MPPMQDAHVERVFGFRDHASLWFSLGVGLLVIQVGAYLVPALGPGAAAFAIGVGSLLGAAMLGGVAQLGCDRGASSASLMAQTMGPGFARVPVVLNIVQLLGWTAFELVVMRDGVAAMVEQATGLKADWVPVVATVVFGAMLFGLASGSMITLVRRFIGRYGLPLVIASLAWLTVQFVGTAQALPGGLAAALSRPGDGSMSTVAAIDLVMAMPVSWLPLVADYARHGRLDGPDGRGRRSAFAGTLLGIFVANVWCYGLGVLVVSTVPPGDSLVNLLLLAQFGLVALGLILIDEMDNAYGDVHSGAVSLTWLWPRAGVITWGRALTGLAVVAAMALPMHALEPFLLMLSSVFVPLFGVILASLAFGGAATEKRVDWPSAAIWLVGVGAFHAGPQLWPTLGSGIPSLVITLALAALVRRLR